MTDTQYKSTLYDKLLSLVIHDLSQGLLIRLLLVIFIYAGVFIINRLGWDEFRASSLIATILAAIILFITSPSTRTWISSGSHIWSAPRCKRKIAVGQKDPLQPSIRHRLDGSLLIRVP